MGWFYPAVSVELQSTMPSFGGYTLLRPRRRHHSSHLLFLVLMDVTTLRPNMKINFQVRYMAIGRTGQSVVLAGDGSLIVLYLNDRLPSPVNDGLCSLDSFGKAWLVAFTSSCECAVIEMKAQRSSHPLQIGGSKDIDQGVEGSETGSTEIMSRELLLGPKDIPIPQVSSSGRSLTADSIEGRSILHDHCKLLHEKYVEYAHKVYVELKYHGVRLNRVVDDQQLHLQEAHEKLHMDAIMVNRRLEERLKKFSNLPGVKEKPLTAAEHDFKSQLDMMSREDLDVLHSAIEVLNARFERYMRLSQERLKNSPLQTVGGRRLAMPETQMSRLKTAVGKLSQIVEDTSRNIKLVEGVVRRRESMGDQ